MRMLGLATVLILPLSAMGQVTINVYNNGGPSRQTYGSGCMGHMAGGSGCTGFTAGSIYSNGCAGGGRTMMMTGGGCQGSQGGSMGFTTVVTQPASQYTMTYSVSGPTAASSPAPYGVYGAVPARVNGPAMYMSGQAPYGARVGGGQWATPSGDPPPPGILAVPGAPFPLDGPVRRGFRAFFGYDSGRG